MPCRTDLRSILIIAVGLRGVGKTVLLNRNRQTTEALGCRICFVEAHEQMHLSELLVPHLRRVLRERS